MGQLSSGFVVCKRQRTRGASTEQLSHDLECTNNKINVIVSQAVVHANFHCSVSTCPNRKDGLLLYKYATVLVNQLAKPVNSLHSNRLKAVLVLSSLISYYGILFKCFIALVSSALF